MHHQQVMNEIAHQCTTFNILANQAQLRPLFDQLKLPMCCRATILSYKDTGEAFAIQELADKIFAPNFTMHERVKMQFIKDQLAQMSDGITVSLLRSDLSD
jgi:hypothetical protein